MNEHFCKVCWQPVSMKPAKEAERVEHEGGFAHRRCVAPSSKTEAKLWDIFGNPGLRKRQSAGPALVAADLGHIVTNGPRPPRDSPNQSHLRPWSCTCGMTGHGQDEKQEHYRTVLLLD